jgi:hypothetical protein
VHYTDTATRAIAGQWNNPGLSGVIDVPGTKLDVTGSGAWGGTLVKQGSGQMRVALGSSAVAAGSVLDVRAGSVVFATDVGATDENLSVRVGAAGSARFESTTHLTAIDVADTRIATIAPGGSRVLVTGGIDLHDSGTLDLADNKLVVRGGDVAAISALLQSGLNGGGWDGSGITTSMSDAQTSLATIGIATGEQTGHAGGTFGGVSVAATDVLVMYTYAGDANLDGTINPDDYANISFNDPNPGASGYYNGDFNYDGEINADDFALIDFNFNAQGAPFGFAADGSMAVTAVPEVSGVALSFVSFLSAFCRRRRRRTA